MKTKPFQKENKIVIDCGDITLREDGIIHMKFKSDYLVEIKDLKDIVEAVGELGNGKKFLNLIEGGLYTNISVEARKYSICDENNIYTIADAFLVKSLAQRLMANFYIRFDKPKLPTRFFDSKEEAEEWLKEFLPKK